MYDFILNN